MTEYLITKHLDLWTSAIEAKSTAGRGNSNKFDLYGIKKLRELILELAVRGKLVPQDPNDEPASLLLERIAAEKKVLFKDKRTRWTDDLSPIANEETSFELPDQWQWSRLGFLFNSIQSGGTPSKRESKYWGGTIPWASVKDLGKSIYISKTEDFITEEGLISGSKLAQKGDILICTRMGLGKIAIAEAPIAFNQDLKAVTLTSGINIDYFLYTYRTLKIKGTGTTVEGIKQEQLISYVIGLPPLQEQNRIVAKIDELMALCDQLEQQTLTSMEAHTTLVETLLATLTASADADELAQNWNRISEHFDTLFTTEQSIDLLKQTILQLAVMGKLVPQDPTDEPASVLLEKIAAEKAQLIKDKKIKKEKPLPPISDDEKPFELPQGWEWCRFEDVVDIQSGITKGRKLIGRELTTVKYLAVANVQRGYLQLDTLKEIELPVDELDKYRVLENDLLITEGGDWDKVGRTAIWCGELPYIAHQNHVFKARVFLESQSEKWLEIYLNSPFAREYFAGSSKQTTNLASINKTQLRGCLIAVPMAFEKQKIVERLQGMWRICEQLKLKINKCDLTKQHITDAVIHTIVQGQ